MGDSCTLPRLNRRTGVFGYGDARSARGAVRMGNFCRVELVGGSQSTQGVPGKRLRGETIPKLKYGVPPTVRAPSTCFPSLGPGPKDKSCWNSNGGHRVRISVRNQPVRMGIQPAPVAHV